MPKTNTFEESLQALREVVQSLESGDCTLEESIKLFEKGTKLSNQCLSILNKAENKINSLTTGEVSDVENS